jgi:hypothetical protein
MVRLCGQMDEATRASGRTVSNMGPGLLSRSLERRRLGRGFLGGGLRGLAMSKLHLYYQMLTNKNFILTQSSLSSDNSSTTSTLMNHVIASDAAEWNTRAKGKEKAKYDDENPNHHTWGTAGHSRSLRTAKHTLDLLWLRAEQNSPKTTALITVFISVRVLSRS